MPARDKLKAAEYFLKKIRDLQDANEEFRFNLGAFLSEARGIPDYLLEDYNVKYCLQIPLTEKLYPEVFEDRARKAGNKVAIDFIQFWREKMDDLMKDPIGLLLTSKRHIGVHRTQIKPDLVKVEVQNTVTPSTSVEIEVYDKCGKLVQAYKSPEQLPKPKESKVSVNWFFSEYDKEPAVVVCEKYLEMMRKLVDDAESRSP